MLPLSPRYQCSTVESQKSRLSKARILRFCDGTRMERCYHSQTQTHQSRSPGSCDANAWQEVLRSMRLHSSHTGKQKWKTLVATVRGCKRWQYCRVLTRLCWAMISEQGIHGIQRPLSVTRLSSDFCRPRSRGPPPQPLPNECVPRHWF